ncbi:MAG: hypothetical protein IJS32_00255 [Kiritimatiellae bacterium]|nr:hypothetical protein [Kiritimatiellia bacterium]
MKYSLAIAHRVCPALSKTAALFDDKYEMVKATTASLANALAGVNAKLTVILDGCPPSYARLFRDAFKGMACVSCEFVETPSIGNAATYAKQHDILSGMAGDAEFLYFSEDDYLYEPEALREMMRFLRQPGVDFVTPLDHPDRYTHIVPERLKVEVRATDFRHWREVGTTCCTFMVKSATFKRAARRLGEYGRGSGDGPLWIGITKERIFSPAATIGAALRYFAGRRQSPEGLEFSTLAAWKWHKLALPFGRRYRLWGPIPSLATHLCKSALPLPGGVSGARRP